MRSRTTHGLAVTIALLAFGCGPIVATPIVPVGSPLSPKQPLMAEFDENLAKWQAAGIKLYAFSFAPFCFCALGEHLVVGDRDEVRVDGVAVGAMAPPPGTPVGVDGLFGIVRRAIQGDRATITYDSATGVPIAMDSDPIANAIDDELSFKVTGWTLDPPDDRVLGRITTGRRLWERQNVASYSWSFRIACDCVDDGRRFDVTVKDGEPTAVRSGGKRIAFDPIDPAEPFSVSRLFDVSAGSATVAQTSIEFDPRLGYPILVEVHDDRPDAVRSWSVHVISFEIP